MRSLRILCCAVQIFAGLLVGAMLPYWFSAMTMKSVGKAALAMVEEVRRQFNTIPGIMEGTARPDYRLCVEISTQVRLLTPNSTPPWLQVRSYAQEYFCLWKSSGPEGVGHLGSVFWIGMSYEVGPTLGTCRGSLQVPRLPKCATLFRLMINQQAWLACRAPAQRAEPTKAGSFYSIFRWLTSLVPTCC